MRLRFQRRRLRTSTDGRRAWGFGFRAGYWPCLNAPYVQATVLFWQLDLWVGKPSYKYEVPA